MSDLPKEQQTAFQRWEMSSFGDERPSALAEKAAQQTAISMQQLAEIAALKEDARKEGYAVGFKEGEERGLKSAKETIDDQIECIRNVANSFANSVATIDQIASESVLELAMDVAKAMIKNEIRTRPDLLTSIITKSLQSLPFTQNISITINPSDFELAKKAFNRQITESGWEVFEDENVEAGGCKIDTERNHIDLTLQKRWQSIAESLRSTNTEF